VDPLRVNKQMSHLKFVRAMSTSKRDRTARYGLESPLAGAQIGARVAEARDVNDGLRALFLSNMADTHGSSWPAAKRAI
jgi:hypothetical protein